ncbi:MAG TPA: DUF6176 family protein [Burkholderiaceae bacterium]|nr:DUF6176 family protein [Burkholderiaceae bacterium]HNB45043.1 DUF6176 family protein [Burkholderiaceae bacterium]HNG80953.1 DUF6176 family protein [Burkholderiaceae bacterium]
MTYKTEFMSFAIQRGKEARAQEWMDMLRQHHADCVKTLDREAMHFESIFRSAVNGVTYLSWFSVQGAAGAHVASSPFAVDQLHLAFWEECVDRSAPPLQFEHVISFIPPSVLAAIEDREQLISSTAARSA